mmetsp:Transcript_944/g.2375  ORF Transcript_944/g.2375 Transcript_944/m.2375 type:complete len:161 (-) Transcript_944:1295-1777(-)
MSSCSPARCCGLGVEIIDVGIQTVARISNQRLPNPERVVEWREAAADDKRKRRIAKKAVARLRHSGALSVLNLWQQRARQLRKSKSSMQAVVGRWRRQSALRCFELWNANLIRLQKQRDYISRVALRMEMQVTENLQFQCSGRFVESWKFPVFKYCVILR